MLDRLRRPACIQLLDRLGMQVRGEAGIGATASGGPVREGGRAGGQPGGCAVQFCAATDADVPVHRGADQGVRKHAAAPAGRVQLQQPLRARFLQGRQRISRDRPAWRRP